MVPRRVIHPCPDCGGEKLLQHSHVCGYCYEIAALGHSLLRESPIDPEAAKGLIAPPQLVDFHFGAGLAVSLSVLAVGVGAVAAAGVLAVGGWSLATLASATLAGGGAASVTFGLLASACLLRLRARRPGAVVGLTDTLLGLPWRRARALWREIGRVSGADTWDPLAIEEDKWP